MTLHLVGSILIAIGVVGFACGVAMVIYGGTQMIRADRSLKALEALLKNDDL